ncbi:MAG: ABC transporter permease subunit [Chloroflexi bacterium]|nr:ABC transporter permease subunit [Chloroflexota bacterium]
MALLTRPIPRFSRYDWQMAMTVTRREVRDSFRDWRIIIPIFLLTLGFPGLMNFTAGRLLNFMENYGAEVIGNQLIPFLLLVVGFFPMSFSLIIALETFVGEKERRSLEPLLATPLTNTQLYLGKMIAALVPPLFASYVGMLVYLVGLYLSIEWTPSFELLALIFLLTTVQGIIMVAGAVVVSSQVTSVRAANLLASFIIVPMALLIQGEAAAMFWGTVDGLWWLAFALGITAVVLVRMGVAIFNREELMGSEIDQLRIGWMWQQFWGHFSGRFEAQRYPNPIEWYKQTFAILPRIKTAVGAQFVAFIGAIILGVVLANQFKFPPVLQAEMTGENMVSNLDALQVYLAGLPLFIIVQNVRALTLQSLLGVFTFGVLGILVFMVPWVIISFVATQFHFASENAFTFVLATVVPHGIVELPALLIASAAGLRWHAVVIAPPPEHTLSEAFLIALAEFVRLFVGIVIPMMIVAALLESFVTPRVLLAIYGG